MSDIKGIELEGQHIVLKEGVLQPRYSDLTWRTVLAKGGFGCNPNLRGSAVIAEHVRDGETARYERYDVERLATEEEVARATRFRDGTATWAEDGDETDLDS